MSTYNSYKFGRLGLATAVVLTALVAALALSSVTDAAGSLSFGDAPTDWSITSGEADDNVGKVAAKGLKKKNRIRYSLAGASGFSIKSKSGVVSYDGSAIDAEHVQLSVTARDSKGKAESASVVITVSVAHDAPVATVALDDPQSGGDDPAIGAVIAARAVAGVADALAQAAAAAQTPAATNSEPRFADDVAIRIVAENSPAGALVGAPLTASDSDHDSLTYSLSGSDAFRIGASSGQIAVAEGAVLDYETQPAYTLTVGVSDGKNASGGSDPSVDDTVEVVVSLSDVDETETVQQVQRQQPPQPQNMEPRSDPTLEMYQADWRRIYDSDQSRYRTVMRPAPSLFPMIGEGRSEEAFIYVDTYDAMKKDGTSLTWELDDDSKALGFRLEQMQITGVSQGTPSTRHVPYAKSSEQTIALSYNGTSWGKSDQPALNNFKIKITGTTDEPEKRKNTVEIEVCFLRSE